MTAKKKEEKPEAAEIDSSFDSVMEAFAGVRDVTRETRKGFGSGALKVKGKIFAMTSSMRRFVVKLPKHRVDELVRSGKGERFVPSPGRVMKEWAVLKGTDGWIESAKEAYDFVRRSS